MKRLGRVFIAVILLYIILRLGNTSFIKLGNESEFKDFSIFEKLNAFILRIFNKVDLDVPEPVPNTREFPEITTTIASSDSSSTSNISESIENTETTEVSSSVDETSAHTITRQDLDNIVIKIRISESKNDSKYDRNEYEKPVKIYDLKGKSLSRNKYSAYTSEYLISEDPFRYKCPYTGLVIEDDSKLDYDHIIALGYIHKYGNVSWNSELKNRYSYNIDVGVNVLNKANRSKSDKGPSDWLPDTNIENYCYTWLVIAAEYDIALRKKDIDTCLIKCRNAIDSGIELKRIN